MINELRLTNIVLIESAIIPFKSGFNVLSGESGSGKSAILNALHLLAGARCDVAIIRKGAEKGVIEAIFDIEGLTLIPHLLEEVGIDHQEGDELLIRREIHVSGKSRAFINNQPAQIAVLKHISDYLFEIVGQHSNQKLLSTDYHRHLLDLYGKLKDDVTNFAELFEEENEIRACIEHLKNSQSRRLREIEICRMEIEEIEKASLKEGEEEDLFDEFTRLMNADELTKKISEITQMFFSDKIAVLTHLSKNKSAIEYLARLDSTLSDSLASYQNALIELQEVAHTLRNYESHIEHDPHRIEFLNDRLALITHLKKKYGNSIEEIHIYLAQTQEKLSSLETTDIQIEDLEKKLTELSDKCNTLSLLLTSKREGVAATFSQNICKHLAALNMPKVEFKIKITPQKRNKTGNDEIEFFILPNAGESYVSLCEHASGGELSRTLIALQALMAGQKGIPTIIFDEVDANIGGETASIVGEKIREIGLNHQVLCITHFPQVAKFANHHLHIFKTEIKGRTITKIDLLDDSARKKELARMHG